MFGGFRRPKHEEFSAYFLDYHRQLVAVVGRHVAGTAMRAIIIARA